MLAQFFVCRRGQIAFSSILILPKNLSESLYWLCNSAMVHTSPSLLSSTVPSSSIFPSNYSFYSSPSSDWLSSVNSSSSRLFSFRKRFFPKSNFSSKHQLLVADDGGSAQQFLQNNSIADFMRFIKRSNDSKFQEDGDGNGNGDGDGGTSELQTALVTYRKKFPWSILHPFLQVDLVSTIHIADKEYFVTLQKELEAYDCVLYEMVASRESLESRRNPAAKKILKASRPQGFSILGCIQRQMARLLMLDFQLDCLDYQAENWYHADLDFETFQLLQLEKGESFFTFARDMTLKSTKAIVQATSIPENLDPWRSKLLWASRALPMPLVGLFIIGSVCADMESPASEYPELEALSRLDFGAAMKVFLAKRLTSEFTQVTAEVEEKSVIIGERNRAATEALRRAFEKGHNKIAILYGGGHMPDLGRRLRDEFNLVPSKVQWITAWSITNQNTKASNSLPFLKTMAKVLGWPLNRYQTIALLIFSSILALDLWFWELFFNTTVDWLSNVVSDTSQYIDRLGMM